MNACFCIGPQNGEPYCPCQMREGRDCSDFMKGYRLGFEQGRKERKERKGLAALRDNGR